MEEVALCHNASRKGGGVFWPCLFFICAPAYFLCPLLFNLCFHRSLPAFEDLINRTECVAVRITLRSSLPSGKGGCQIGIGPGAPFPLLSRRYSVNLYISLIIHGQNIEKGLAYGAMGGLTGMMVIQPHFLLRIQLLGGLVDIKKSRIKV